MQGFYTILLLIVSNVFMTLAWYGHLKLQEMKVISNWPLYAVILFSWSIALAEYSCQVPANRIGFKEKCCTGIISPLSDAWCWRFILFL